MNQVDVRNWGRREFLTASGLALASAPAVGLAKSVEMPFANGVRPLVKFPQKREMILLTTRPPQLETPFEVFNQGLITPNDAFFVRYHLSGLPDAVDPARFRLKIGGHVGKLLELSLASLKRDFAVQEIVAVNQCSGNSRGFVEPRVGGGQLGNGAMGNARWRGVSLKALLDRAGVREGARQVTFNGLDNPPLDVIPDFVKALDLDHARDGEVMVAFQMNGQDLPYLNGYPLRLIVPGHYGTYWVKHLNEITVVDAQFDGYWMKTAYRIPDNDCNCLVPGQKLEKTRPIGRFNVRSFVTSHADGAKVAAGRPVELRGIAFAGGSNIARVLVSADGGQTWQEARLGEDLGRYSFREWRLGVDLQRGSHAIMVRAMTADGETQPLEQRWQPAGYMRNVVEKLKLEVA
ncbi:molybdopterin-dependent oxidoreductase [Novosphingobium sp. B1]|uniref:SorA family sulfite dehydrogenase catalytic subunit n=1 Tax=Novosphingobium sp. B1 TaxID=1938756 RepID=UPI0009D7CCC8|nr:molybdopterin-dependent oxidoreductase [Novosphingobium sp. B1]SMC37494.1 sulfite dehydrogenase (cytochrome) subunit SorA apoprotein [Novosphingobium sp. B1]